MNNFRDIFNILKKPIAFPRVKTFIPYLKDLILVLFGQKT